MKKMFKMAGIAAVSFFVAVSCTETEPDWDRLYNEENLDQWVQLNGEANYSEEDGTIVGETVLNTPNSFLCTKKDYSDFILEVDLKVDEGLNSGIQIRSHSIPEYKDNRVHGYQVEIDPSDRAWSGGIYDEARRGWLYDLEDNEPARQAFNVGEWNTYRIEALGDTIQTWVNGVPAANLVDNMTDEGFIGLQVHGVGDDEEKEGLQVRWRDMKILTGDKAWANNQSMDIPQKTNLNNHLTEEEKQEGWELLFDGETHEGWRGAHKDQFPEKGWIVHNGAINVVAEGGGESIHGGDIVTEEEFSDFELKLDFKMTEGANSGIKYYVTENEGDQEGSALGLEYQILDDEKHPDAKKGRNGNRTLASLYDMIPAEDKEPNPIGEWNHARIVSDDNHVEHWLNGDKVLEYERGSEDFRKLVEMSKYSAPEFEEYGGPFGEAEKGHILLQEHGHEVFFRNIKIKRLD
ncbi:MAG: 3-keto-disaccharide hydrolase [Bacteroidota bacterium]